MTKSSILKSYKLIENTFFANMGNIFASDNKNSLCNRLKNGLNKLIKADSLIATMFSSDVRMENIFIEHCKHLFLIEKDSIYC